MSLGLKNETLKIIERSNSTHTLNFIKLVLIKSINISTEMECCIL